MPSLRAGQVVGVLTVPGCSIEILPKIGGEEHGAVRRALVHMLAVAWGVPIADSEAALLGTQRQDLLEILVRLFADTLYSAVRRGLPHRYRLREETLPLLRGKLDMRRQLASHAFRSDRLACTFDELSVDTPLNRVLKSAVVRLASATRSSVNSRRLSELSARFEFVGDSLDPLRERVRLDRTNRAFHRLHNLARLFLAGDWQSTTTGGSEGIALLFPMNDLFEEFVGRSMLVALAPRSVLLQHRGHYALTGQHSDLFALRPDIVVDDDILIDTKWKELNPHESTVGVDQADVYQMLAYARAYEAQRVVLLYPWHEGLANPGIYRSWRIKGTSTRFDIATVDVGRPDSVQHVLRSIVVASS
ncbi:MAG: McrC family protein [Bryobacterales bacterium]|nr:McrC family protein [Bryobacterales bacterium]